MKGKNKPMSAYERMETLEGFRNVDWDLEKETQAVVAKIKKMRFDAFLSAGFTEAQALYLVGADK